MAVTTALDLTFRAGLLVGVIAIPFLVINWTRYVIALNGAPLALVPFPTKTVLFFVAPLFVAMAAAEIATSISRQKVVELLRQPDATQFRVLVNDRPVTNGSEIVVDLRGISSDWGHHSHPTKRTRLQIDGASDRLLLELGRDSDRPHEYWVFDPSGAITTENEIGRVTTQLLDSY